MAKSDNSKGGGAKGGSAKGDNIVLIGMPGAGKSTLGVVLAKRINYRFVDSDLLIQERFGKTLEQLIAERGPQGFFDAENEVLAGIDAQRTIISTGGSAVYSDEAMRHLGDIGTIVFLRVSLDQLADRLGDLDERGVVLRSGPVRDLNRLYEERTPLYERYADITFDAGEAPIGTNAIALHRLLAERGLL